MTRRKVVRSNFPECRLLPANLLRHRTTRPKPAARRKLRRTWHRTRNRLELSPLFGQRRERTKQRLSVRMPWSFEKQLDRCGLDNFARVHHHYAITGLSDNAQIVRY